MFYNLHIKVKIKTSATVYLYFIYIQPEKFTPSLRMV